MPTPTITTTNTSTTTTRSTQNSIRLQQVKYIFPSIVINQIPCAELCAYKKDHSVSWLNVTESD